MEVRLFIPCFVDQLFPETAFNMVKVLQKLGCSVSYDENQTCCGQPAYNAGFQEESKVVCEKFVRENISASGFIVAPSASCTGFVRNYYPKIFDNSSVHNEVRDLRSRTYEFTEFLVDVLKVENLGARLAAKVTYHDSCAALRECKIKEGPRKLLSQVEELELVEMTDNETCCGFGGTFAIKYEPISISMADQKTNHALQTGAEYIVSTDLSCLMHLDGYIRKKGLPLKTMHIADVLASGW